MLITKPVEIQYKLYQDNLLDISEDFQGLLATIWAEEDARLLKGQMLLHGAVMDSLDGLGFERGSDKDEVQTTNRLRITRETRRIGERVHRVFDMLFPAGPQRDAIKSEVQARMDYLWRAVFDDPPWPAFVLLHYCSPGELEQALEDGTLD